MQGECQVGIGATTRPPGLVEAKKAYFVYKVIKNGHPRPVIGWPGEGARERVSHRVCCHKAASRPLLGDASL
jgi:hypothetical protein